MERASSVFLVDRNSITGKNATIQQPVQLTCFSYTANREIVHSDQALV